MSQSPRNAWHAQCISGYHWIILKFINPQTSWFGWMCGGHVWDIMEKLTTCRLPFCSLLRSVSATWKGRKGRKGGCTVASLGQRQRTWAFWSALNEEKMWWDDMSQWWSSRLRARAHSSQLHTPVPLAHHTSHKNSKIHFPPKKSKISKINSRMIFIQKYPRNYCSISSQIAYKFLLCFFVKMCFAKLHFLTVHLQTSHSISIWLYAFL